MTETNPTDCVEHEAITLAALDAKTERIVLGFLIDEHPRLLTIPELSLALNACPGSFEGDDAVERAVCELVGAGLLRCCDGYVVPTRPALYLAGLGVEL
jgi:hypothetical protein